MLDKKNITTKLISIKLSATYIPGVSRITQYLSKEEKIKLESGETIQITPEQLEGIKKHNWVIEVK